MIVKGRCVGWVVVDKDGTDNELAALQSSRRAAEEDMEWCKKHYPEYAPYRIAAVVIPAKRGGKGRSR